jgi:hypothetical protein
MKTLLASSALVAMLAAAPVAAAPQIFFDTDSNGGANTLIHPNSDATAAAFFDVLGQAGAIYATDDFESYAPGTTPTVLNQFGSITATLNAGLIYDTEIMGRFAISGSQYLSTNSAVNEYTLSFSDPIFGFGFYAIDANDELGEVGIDIETTNGNHLIYMINDGHFIPNGSALFWGLFDLDLSISSVTFFNDGANVNDIVGIDNFTIASHAPTNATPEPGVLALLGLGLCGLGAFRVRAHRPNATARG